MSDLKYGFSKHLPGVNIDAARERVTALLATEGFGVLTHIDVAATLKKKISGSIDGEAIQNDITGPNGTPPIKSEATTGIKPHEQNGLNAPTTVARMMAGIGRAANARRMWLAAPLIWTTTASGMVISRYGQILTNDRETRVAISMSSYSMFCSIIVKSR